MSLPPMIMKFLMLLFLFPLFSSASAEALVEENPIQLWYGEEQVFGKTGNAQRYINVLGHLDRSQQWRSLAFSLNGSDFSDLSIGPDTRRLNRKGDFNVEILFSELNDGDNIVLIKAISKNGIEYTKLVNASYEANDAQLNKSIDWKNVDEIADVAQVIDGYWEIDYDRLISDPEYVGYDRVIGFGDTSWSDYEVQFPFTVLALDESAYGSEASQAPALLMTLRWQGHTDSPVTCSQPHCGWEPFGALVNFSFEKPDSADTEVITRWRDEVVRHELLKIIPGVEYWVKLRAQSSAFGNYYSIKLWTGGPSNEPSNWSLRSIANPLNLKRGAFLLVAHHINLSVGNMVFSPISTLGSLRGQIVQTITESADILVQLPYLLIWLIGIVWGLKFKRRDAQRGKWIVRAFILIFITSLAGSILNSYVPGYLQDNGWITRRVTYIYVLINMVPILGHLVGWGLIFWKLMPPSSSANK